MHLLKTLTSISMKDKVIILDVFETQTGVSKNGKNWRKEIFLVETMDQYPTKYIMQSFKPVNPQIGEEIEFYISIESRESGGKWYTSVTGNPIGKRPDRIPVQTVAESISQDEDNDLPF